MKNIAILLLVVAVAALGIFAYYQETSLRELRDRFETVSKTTDLDLQQKCARQAGEAFSHDFLASLAGKDPLTNFTNHYNSKLGKCFVLININVITARKTMSETKFLSDAFEGKSYGVYGREGDNVTSCEVTLPTGEKRRCHSSTEFEDLINVYMEQ